MIRRHLKNKGFAILSVVLAGVIIAVSFMAVNAGLARSRAISLIYRYTVIAENYVGELLELFRSMPSDRLKQYFSANPVNGAFSPYFFCSLVNFLKRAEPANPANDLLINEDPIAAMPNSVLGGTANRYYQIHIVKRKSLEPQLALCGNNASNLFADLVPQKKPPDPPPPLLPGPDKPGYENRFYVTVGVTWINPTVGLRRVSAGAIIP